MEPDYNNNYQNNFQSGFQPNGFDDLHLDDEIYEIKSDRINPEDFYQHSRKKRYSEVSLDRKSTRLNSSHTRPSRMPSSA